MNPIRFSLVAIATGALLFLPLYAEAAQGCKLLRVAEWPVSGDRNQFTIDGAVNGKKVGILLDTGASLTLIQRAAAARLGLERQQAPGYRMFGVGGETEVESAVIDEFRLGSATRRNFRVLVAGEHDFGKDIAVVLGDDFFENAELELDIPGKVIRLFQARDCEGQSLAYWAPGAAGEVELEPGSKILFKVQVNGRPVQAMLDTGATTSVLARPVAESAGIKMDAPGVAAAGCAYGFGRRVAEVWVAPFESFVIGNELIRNPRLRVAALWKHAVYHEMGSRLARSLDDLPDMLLGADFLRTHRVLVSRSQRKMYFTYSGGLVFPSVPSVACGERPGTKGVDGNLADFDAAIRADPRNAMALIQRARVHAERRDYDLAIADYDTAILLQARSAEVYIDRGNAWLAKGDADRALADYARAIELDPSGTRAYLARASLWIARKDYDKALADLDAVFRIEPTNPTLYLNRGVLWRNRREYDKAIADYDLAIRHDARSALAHAYRGNAWREKGDAERAFADLARAIELDPEGRQAGSLAYSERAVLWRRRMEFDKAIADFDAAIRVDPRNAMALIQRARVHAERRDYDLAIADYDTAILLQARSAEVYIDRGNAWLAKGDADRALADYARAIELDPSGTQAYLARASLWITRKDYDKALADLDAVFRIEPTNPTLYLNRGVLWRNRGEYDKAIADFDMAIRHDPRNAWAHAYRGNAWRAKGDEGRAFADLARAIELDPEGRQAGSLAYSERAVLWRRRMEFDKAIADCDAALAINPTGGQALRNRGLSHFHLGRFESAERGFAELMRVYPSGENAIWLYVSRARNGKDGRAELRKFADGRKERGWPEPIIGFYLGQRDRGQLMAAAANADPKTRREQECEANFHLGQQRLIAGNAKEARPFLGKAADECPRNFVEYVGAKAELAGIR